MDENLKADIRLIQKLALGGASATKIQRYMPTHDQIIEFGLACVRYGRAMHKTDNGFPEFQLMQDELKKCFAVVVPPWAKTVVFKGRKNGVLSAEISTEIEI